MMELINDTYLVSRATWNTYQALEKKALTRYRKEAREGKPDARARYDAKCVELTKWLESHAEK
jgi:hypothetical protein